MDTERHSPRYNAIDAWNPSEILDAMIEGQLAAVAAVRAARAAIEESLLAMEPRLRDGGRIVYAPEDLRLWADRGVRQSTSDPGRGTVKPAKPPAGHVPLCGEPAPRRGPRAICGTVRSSSR